MKIFTFPGFGGTSAAVPVAPTAPTTPAVKPLVLDGIKKPKRAGSGRTDSGRPGGLLGGDRPGVGPGDRPGSRFGA